ncbi:hypothetical protein DFH06DRAFT_1476309 [Mycena polygramma]|nr:hypothetical protein DFH06DRAFT_1476309 [Mycena polygramma]
MSRAKSKSTKPREMFDPYVAEKVPDVMPLPELARVVFSKGDEAAVPVLNHWQRSWIFDVSLRGLDLASMSGKDAKELNERIKDEAFDAKAFQHTVQLQDREEELRVATLVAAWKEKDKQKRRKKAGTPAAEEEDDASDEEQDEGARGSLLRGYPKHGWRVAIQKVLSNKRTAEKSKNKKHTPAEPAPPAPNLSKLFGLVAYTGRDKFREDNHDKINEYAKTLPGSANPGGKFRKAEALLWADEDQASWEAAAAGDEDVDWTERQQLVPSGFKHMVQTLHAGGRFRPFMATMLMAWLNEDGQMHFEWAQAVPGDINAGTSFKKRYPEFVNDSVNKMHEWAEQPLRAYAGSAAEKAKKSLPVFEFGVEALDDLTFKMLVQKVKDFLVASFEAAFGNSEIPWAAIANSPSDYYDVARFPVVTTLGAGLDNLTHQQWHDLARAMASEAGEGSSGLFRKAHPASPPLPPSRPASPPLPPSRPASPTPPPSRPVSPPPLPPWHHEAPLPPPPSRPASPPHPLASRPASPPPSPPPRSATEAGGRNNGKKKKAAAPQNAANTRGTAVPPKKKTAAGKKRDAPDTPSEDGPAAKKSKPMSTHSVVPPSGRSTRARSGPSVPDKIMVPGFRGKGGYFYPKWGPLPAGAESWDDPRFELVEDLYPRAEWEAILAEAEASA